MNGRSIRSRYVIAAVACLGLGAALGPTLGNAAADKIKDVVVANTDANPVPTKAVVQNTDANPVPTRAVGTTPVTIAGQPTSSVVTKNLVFTFSGQSSAISEPYTVPAGKRLEIEFVTFTDLNRPVGVKRLSVAVRQGGDAVGHTLATTQVPGGGDVATLQTKIVADPNTTVDFIVVLTEPLGNAGTTQLMDVSFVGTLTGA